MTKHTAKRIRTGLYHYRGYEIENMAPFSDTGYAFWNIRALGECSAHDSCNTLAESKALIDCWVA